MGEPITPSVLHQVELSPGDRFFAHLEAAVRDALCWYPEVATHASVSGVHPETGEVWTAYGRRIGPADLEVRVKEDSAPGETTPTPEP